MPSLFDPIKMGAFDLPNRIIMSPMTRARSDEARVPNDMMVEYYVQRASAGLIITEGVAISPMAVGYANTPGIWTAEQVDGWKHVTHAVHAAGGRIMLQLWHVGRISDPMFLGGELPVAPSAVRPAGFVSLVRPQRPFVVPRALAIEELPGIVEEFRLAAENAQRAGFDGVQLHGANGYLLDQFLQDSTNKRDDAYGGSIANRARLMLEVTDAVTSVWGADRVAMHLNLRCNAQDMGDSDPLGLFTHVARALSSRSLAFVIGRESLAEPRIAPAIREAYHGIFVANEGFTQETGEAVLASGEADAVAYGQPFIANPDLIERFRCRAELNPLDRPTFQVGGAKGYVDYPKLGIASGH
ncbi:alkene reductase [Mesorhizobium sp. M7A.F.Ca.US.006.01.1.1]|uniref:alkene reductase n=1 Tax=Mesorhizobium sp. M7A.F.Ca.US.006.01.1.1 TaxID=2496707 RepID=UPI000FCC08B5|nr:alkene reductase [Mesorhizobium sp. M7A.F.Ca.US.006.01.1.1]RUZ72331.1 alkene reductase [Mesorhizobium sp. M7A.F.Ca.US.006.01.1.1]